MTCVAVQTFRALRAGLNRRSIVVSRAAFDFNPASAVHTGSLMFNHTARSVSPAPSILPLRQTVVAAFRARVKTLPAAPDSLSDLLLSLDTDFMQIDALSDVQRALFRAPGREKEAQAFWREAMATALYASHLARARGASVRVAACGGLFHRAGEAYALRSLALAESENGVRLDGPSKSEMCGAYGADVIERLVREWSLPPAVAACVLGWRRFGEFAGVSVEASAVYFAHLLSAEMLHPYLTPNGALDAAGEELGFAASTLREARALSVEVRERINLIG